MVRSRLTTLRVELTYPVLSRRPSVLVATADGSAARAGRQNWRRDATQEIAAGEKGETGSGQSKRPPVHGSRRRLRLLGIDLLGEGVVALVDVESADDGLAVLR